MLDWSVSDKIFFKKLQDSSFSYFKAKLNFEFDKRGTGGEAFAILEAMKLNQRMMKDIYMINQCKVSGYLPNQYEKIDKQLNDIYKEIMSKSFNDHPVLSHKGIIETERAWIKYRDAWIRLGKSRCPKVSTSIWGVLLTKERIKELEELAEITCSQDAY